MISRAHDPVGVRFVPGLPHVDVILIELRQALSNKNRTRVATCCCSLLQVRCSAHIMAGHGLLVAITNPAAWARAQDRVVKSGLYEMAVRVVALASVHVGVAPLQQIDYNLLGGASATICATLRQLHLERGPSTDRLAPGSRIWS